MKSREIEVSARRWARAVSVREVREQLFSWRERREGKGGTEFRFTGFEERSSSWVVEGRRWDLFKVTFRFGLSSMGIEVKPAFLQSAEMFGHLEKKTTYMRVHIESSLGGAETVRGAGGGWGGGGEEEEEKKWRNHSFPSPWNLTCASG